MHLRRTVSALAVAAASLAAATTASAAAPWSDPVAVPGGAPVPGPLLITKDGRALAIVPTDRTAAAPAGAPTEVVPLDAATGQAIPGRTYGLSIVSAQAATYARNRVVVAGSTVDSRGTVSDASHVQVAYGTGGGDLGPLRGITGSTGERSFALDANDDGVVAIVLGNTRERRLLIRRPNGRGFVEAFHTTVTSQGRGATVAVGATGDVLMLWEDQHHVYARHVGPSGGVGAVHRIGDGVQSRLQAAVESGGRLMAAWASQRVSEGEADTPATVRFATAAPGHGFGPARLIEEAGLVGAGRYVADPAVRLLTGGASLLAWTGFDQASRHYVVRVAQVDGGHVGAPQTLSSPAVDAVLGDLGVSAAGAAGVVWRTGIAGADPSGAPSEAQAAVRPGPGQAFGAPEAILAPPSGGALPYVPRIALAPATGAALAAVGVFGPTAAASPLTVAARPAP
jgi:hypothetical protein